MTARIIVEQQKSGSKTRLGCLLRVIPLVIATAVCYHFIGYPLMISGFGNADTRPVSGDPTHFDPIAALPDVQQYAGAGAQLVSIDAEFVRSDGTMDLTAGYTPWPNTEYDYVLEVPRPADAPPPGAGGANSGPWYQPITIKAYQPGHWWNVSGTTSYSYMNQGMEREISSPENGQYTNTVANPTCKFADLWQAALKRDAPKDAVATIQYDQNGYDFSISGLSYDMQFDMNCQVTSSNGIVPTIVVPQSP